MKTITIMIAAYKAEPWIGECLEAIETQQLPDGWQLQIILGVDGCKSTLAAALLHRSDRLTIIELKQNSGTYITFNTMMQYATGEIMGRFDADDVMRPGYLKAQIESIENGADVSMTWSIYTDADLKPTDHVMAHSHYHPKGGLNRRPAEGCYVARRKIWEKLGAYRAWPCSADTDMLSRAKSIGNIVATVEDFLYYRRTHIGSLTANPATNFESPLRKKIMAQMAEYKKKYYAGQMPVWIDPVVGEVAEVYGLAHAS